MKIVRIARYLEHISGWTETEEGKLKIQYWETWRDFVCSNYDWSEKDNFERYLSLEMFSLDGKRNPDMDKDAWLFGMSLTRNGSETLEDAAAEIKRGLYDVFDLDYNNKLLPLLAKLYQRQRENIAEIRRSLEVGLSAVNRVR